MNVTFEATGNTECPSIHRNFGTYLISGMVGQIRLIFSVVKLGTGRFVIKYGTIGYIPICGVNSWVTFGQSKK